MIQIGAPAPTIDTPIEHLMACHRRIEQRLDGLFNAAGHLEIDRAAALEAIRNSLRFLDTSGALHTEDEEASLSRGSEGNCPASSSHSSIHSKRNTSRRKRFPRTEN